MQLKTTRLFDKKWSNFLNENPNIKLETYIFNVILKQGFESSLPGPFALYTTDLPAFVKRCDKCFVQIIAIQTHIDGRYPLHIWCLEEYGEEITDNSWIEECNRDIVAAGVEKDLIIHIDIPIDKVSILRNIYNQY